MARAKHFLMVVGNAIHAVRSGSGTHESAAHEAFGILPHDPSFRRITFREITLTDHRIDVRRTKAIVELLKDHKERFGHMDDIGRLCAAEIERIRNYWKSEWARAAKAQKTREGKRR